MKGTLSRGTIVAGLVLVSAVGGFWMANRRAAAHRASRSDVDRTDAREGGGDRNEWEANRALRAQVAGLEMRLAALSKEVSDQKNQAAVADESSAASSATAEETIEHDRVVWQDHMKEVAAAFQSELRDQTWAQSHTAFLQERLTADQLMRGALRNIDCRSTTCRLDMVDDRKGGFDRGLPAFLQKLGATFPSGQASTIDNPDGTRSVSVYLSTAGQPDGRGPLGS